ncbi:helix-turn-helix domain-containing protein [Nonomuraea sp. NPDC050328]|uniref:helix-turn-helix domain-containing protein n=1 Tax=Nonomuraea sp. NPDC050328 TaxID=3364361 RepID=UPI0037B3BBE7
MSSSQVVWDVARPARPSRIPGLTMAGFGGLARTPADLPLIPHPAVTLAVVFGGGTVTVTRPGTSGLSGLEVRGSLAAGLGLGSGPVRVRHADAFGCVQIRLSPVLAHALLGTGLDELTGLEQVWGRSAGHLAERLAEAPGWAARFALTEQALLARLDGVRADPEVAWTWRRMRTGGGLVRVDELAGEVGWSRKRLWSRFRAQIGLAPKQAARLVRFDVAAHRLAAGVPAARVAAECGYSDQSHLHRDVLASTGLTPTALSVAPFLAVDDLAWSSRPVRQDSRACR